MGWGASAWDATSWGAYADLKQSCSPPPNYWKEKVESRPTSIKPPCAHEYWKEK